MRSLFCRTADIMEEQIAHLGLIIQKMSEKRIAKTLLFTHWRQFLKIALSVICGIMLERFRKKHNVAIKRAKNNALALALSSVSNIDEVNHAKVSKNTLRFIRNVEFLEVA